MHRVNRHRQTEVLPRRSSQVHLFSSSLSDRTLQDAKIAVRRLSVCRRRQLLVGVFLSPGFLCGLPWGCGTPRSSDVLRTLGKPSSKKSGLEEAVLVLFFFFFSSSLSVGCLLRLCASGDFSSFLFSPFGPSSLRASNKSLPDSLLSSLYPGTRPPFPHRGRGREREENRRRRSYTFRTLSRRLFSSRDTHARLARAGACISRGRDVIICGPCIAWACIFLYVVSV